MTNTKTFCVFLLLVLVLVPLAFAGKTELTTYYPAPYGEYINLTSTADSYFATASGNVGIGTTSPAEKLELHDTAGGAVFFRVRSDAPAVSDVYIGSDGTTGPDAGGMGIIRGGVADALAFQTNSNPAINTRMYINNAGNVGIGTTAPGLILESKGNIGGPAASGTTQYGSLRLSNSTGLGVVDMGFSSPGQGWIQAVNSGNLATNYPLVINPNGGNVGIGTTSPSYKLDIVDDQAANYITRIKNSNATNTAKGLIIDLGIANASRTVATRFIDFAGAGVVAGKITGGASTVAYTTVLADFAEYFRADPKNMPQPGELVELDPSGAQSVQRSGGDASRVLVGVVSSSPAFVGNGPLCKVEDADCDANFAKYNALVALVGQVSVKVNTSRGPIAIADPIAASDTPGEGAKAIGAGHIVGYAQESLASGNGTIKVLIRPQYYYNPQSKA